MQDLGVKLKHVVADLGLRGVDADNPDKLIIHRGKFKSLSAQQKGWLRRRQAVEPAIGHLKSDHRMDRCWLQGRLGNALHTVFCAAVATSCAGYCAQSPVWASRRFFYACCRRPCRAHASVDRHTWLMGKH